MMANPRTWALASCLLLLFALSPARAIAQKPAAARATPVREADAACARCHQQIFNSYLKTPMANASGLAGDRWLPGTFHHAPSKTDYRFFTEDGSEWMSYARPGDAGMQGKYR